MATWPRGSQKGLSEFFQKIHQGKELRKMSYCSASSSNFENYQFLTLCPRGCQESVKKGNSKSLTMKPSYSSFFPVLCPDLKNVLFGKIHWAPSEILAVKRPFSRSRMPNFEFHLFLMAFHLEFSLFWVSRLFDLSNLGDLRRGSGNFFKNYIFEISAFQRKRWGMSQSSGRNFH